MTTSLVWSDCKRGRWNDSCEIIRTCNSYNKLKINWIALNNHEKKQAKRKILENNLQCLIPTVFKAYQDFLNIISNYRFEVLIGDIGELSKNSLRKLLLNMTSFQRIWEKGKVSSVAINFLLNDRSDIVMFCKMRQKFLDVFTWCTKYASRYNQISKTQMLTNSWIIDYAYNL